MAAAVGLLRSGTPGMAGANTASGQRCALILLVCLALLSPLLQAGPDEQRQRQLDNLLLQDCGSCHGLRMTGGLGPALTRQALADKPRDSLIATVAHGRPGTAMPGWNALLDEQDIAWLVDRLLQGYPRP
ncbi:MULTISPECIES: cytochrome c [Pseudomonadota]|uniref:c-type cytochrome n=1 Tax=Pseudomonadota TaxID=1224 RepID=UPI002114B821|nr:cytochrome c [Pseudomonas sp. MYb185]